MSRITVTFLLLVLNLYIVTTDRTAMAASRHSTGKQCSRDDDTSFVETSCKSTTYPTLCVQCLSPYADIIQRSPRKMALAALSVSVSNVQSAKSFVSEQKKIKDLKPVEHGAISDCLTVLSDAVDRLNNSVHVLDQMGQAEGQDFCRHISNVQTWVSAALTDEETCLDGFSNKDMDGKVKDSIRAEVVKVAQITSNGLALVIKFAKAH